MKPAPIFSALAALLAAACSDASGPTADNYSTVVRQADEARGSGDYDTAIPLYGRALQANPEGFEARLGLGQVYLAIGAPDEAAAQFRDILARRDTPLARRGLAAALIAMGQPGLAQGQLQEVLRADARDYRALNALGVALDMEGRHAEAQARYREAIAVAPPEYAAVRSNFGLSLAISGQPREALAELSTVAGSSRADARVRQNLAFAYAMAGDLENALQACRRDLDEANAQRQLAYYMQLRALPVEARSAELRRNPAFFPQGGS